MAEGAEEEATRLGKEAGKKSCKNRMGDGKRSNEHEGRGCRREWRSLIRSFGC